MTEPSPPAAADAPAKPRRSRKRRLLKAGLFLLYVLILAEVGSRAYWAIKHGERKMPLFAGSRDWIDRFYEEFRDSGLWDADLRADNDTYDVLFLGGSALDRIHRSLCVETTELPDALAKVVGKPVKVYNLATRA